MIEEEVSTMRLITRRIRMSAVLLVVGVTSMAGLLAMASPSSADVSLSSVALSLGSTVTPILNGIANQAVSGWTITVPNTFATGDSLQLVVNPQGIVSAGLNAACGVADDIEFDGAPTVTVAEVTPGDGGTAPTVTPTLGLEPVTGTHAACTAVGLTNDLTLTFANSETPQTAPSNWTVTVSNVHYSVGSGVVSNPTPTVSMLDSTYTNVTPAATALLVVPPNAAVYSAAVTANTPKVGLLSGADSDQPISPITVTESAPKGVALGYVCVALAHGAFDVTGGEPMLTATGGGVVVGAVTNPSPGIVAFDVTTQSTAAPATYTLSNVHIDGGGVLGLNTVNVTDSNLNDCTGGFAINTTPVTAYDELTTTRTAGADADGTAVAEFVGAFTCSATSPRSVVLATDSNFPDALSASYLAGQLHTGILLTPTATLSTETANALRQMAINTVYVVGGNLAVSNAVVSQLQSMPAYTCGGVTPVTPTEDLTVNVLSGATEYDTSNVIATYFPSNTVGKAAFPKAYGNYDDTSGLSSSAGPTTAARTAILATGTSFEDATSASVIAYSEHFPVVLTTPTALASQAAASLTDLGITQVILVGGPLAVSDGVVTQLEGMGITVLRIAGQDYTDTSQELAAFELDSSAGAGLGWDLNSANQIVLARGDFYSDGLAGAGYAATLAPGGQPEPILLTFDPNTIGNYLSGFLAAGGTPSGFIFDTAGSRINDINVLGGTVAVTPLTLDTALEDIIGGS